MLGCDLGGGAISVAQTRRRDLADASRVGCDLAHSLYSLFFLSLSLFARLIWKWFEVKIEM